MRNPIRSQQKLSGQYFMFIIAALITGCGSSTTTPTTTSTSAAATVSTTSTASTLTISPSSISLSEGGSYTFSASGGSGSGYTFVMGNGGSVAGTVTTSGSFVAATGWTGTTYIEVTDSAGDANFATVNVSGSSTVVSSGALTISPSTVTLAEGASYTFTASGGSGSGYVFLVPSGNEGSIGLSTGLYVAPSSWTGTTMVEVVDSNGNTAYSTITVISNVTTVYSITGTLMNCAGTVAAYSYVNNWQVNGTELRTINDPNNYTESPVYCTGLSVAGSIPSTATIQGVTVGIYLINQSTHTDGSLLQSLNLIYSNSIIGSKTLNAAVPGNTASFPTFLEGTSTDTWSAGLTPYIVNSSTFGIDIQTYRGSDRLFVGDVSGNLPQVTIYYTE